jgi:hypothetical protein
MAVHVVKYLPTLPPPRDIGGAESLPMDSCVIFRGTLRLMRYIQSNRRWRPGGWCTFANLSCTAFHTHFGAFLLNRDYALLPCAEASRLTDRIFARYAKDDRVFVRPDAVDKGFAGLLADRIAFHKALSEVAFDPTTLVQVASPKTIHAEWRLIVANGLVIAGSQYRAGGQQKESADCPDEVVAFAAEVLGEVDWRPDLMFVMDVCDSEDGLRLVELNGFSCAAFYLADLPTVVKAASELAASIW